MGGHRRHAGFRPPLRDPKRHREVLRARTVPSAEYWALYEDSSGTLWAGAESGFGDEARSSNALCDTPKQLIGLNESDDGRLLLAMHGAGLRQLAGDKTRIVSDSSAINRIDCSPTATSMRIKLLRDRDGGLWIGTVRPGAHPCTSRPNGCIYAIRRSLRRHRPRLFEDREGNIWVATTGGLDRFRELPVTTISVKQGLSSDAVLRARGH